jgi:hypothetical protein
MLSGMVYGLAFGAGLREICLVPQRPVDALLPYQAGVTIALLAAGGILTVILQALGTWKPGSVLPRVLALAVLGVGLALLARPYQ